LIDINLTRCVSAESSPGKEPARPVKEVTVNKHAENDCPSPVDVLELGAALVAARPQLCETVGQLTDNSGEASRLVQATLREAWRGRQTYNRHDAVHDWLIGVLRRQILN
jgi:DNA-directed RNA polymerase specialized sigma24 family protein